MVAAAAPRHRSQAVRTAAVGGGRRADRVWRRVSGAPAADADRDPDLLPDRLRRRRDAGNADRVVAAGPADDAAGRSEGHTSELQSLMRISYAVFCLKKKKNRNQ